MTSSSILLRILGYLSNFLIVSVCCGALSPRDLSFNSQATLSQQDNTHDRSNSIVEFAAGFSSDLSPSVTVKAKPTTVYRPRSVGALHRARLRSLHYQESERVEWDRIETLGPDVEDRHTLAQLARMSGNAYAIPGQKNWYDVDGAWNTVCLVHI
jgi:lipase ATG15